MTQSIFDKESGSNAFYTQVFQALALNDILYQKGICKLLRDMTTLEYMDYLKMIVDLEVKGTK